MSQTWPIAAEGSFFKVVWAKDDSGRFPAEEFYDSLSPEDQAKLLVLFRRLATTGRIDNREHFKKLGQRAKSEAQNFWEFKRFQLRFIGEFRPGRFFVIAWGVRKKKDLLDPEDVAKALRILRPVERSTS